MKLINFTKMHGLGNDFVIIDARTNNIQLTQEQIKLICDRKIGVGCDQLLIIRNKIDNDTNYDYIFQIFNNDATEVEQCGNGARCCVKYLLSIAGNNNNIDINHVDQFTLKISNIIRLKSINKIITGYMTPDNLVAINLGSPSFKPEDLPSTHQFNKNNQYQYNYVCTDGRHKQIITYGLVSVGNPHVIIKLNNLDELSDTQHLSNIAQSIQSSEFFPKSVNVNFYVIDQQQNHDNGNNLNNDCPNHNNQPKIIKKSNIIHLRTYERGCGFTYACGTGASATACLGIALGLLEKKVIVQMAKGKLIIEYTNDEIIMHGDATFVFTGQIYIN